MRATLTARQLRKGCIQVGRNLMFKFLQFHAFLQCGNGHILVRLPPRVRIGKNSPIRILQPFGLPVLLLKVRSAEL